uniref:Secreted protein n=1 Tax=Bursaphelenchus xylophilus TaxID=6326 RepID=A0A1I7STI1_BURXY
MPFFLLLLESNSESCSICWPVIPIPFLRTSLSQRGDSTWPEVITSFERLRKHRTPFSFDGNVTEVGYLA